MFRFASPQYLYLCAALLVLLVALYVWTVRRRRARLEAFGDPATVAGLMPDVSPRRMRNKFVLWLLALSCVAMALARPQAGSKLRVENREGIELMLAVDVSNSMLAEDFKPSRLERTKHAIGRLLEGVGEDRVGLIVFAGDAYVQLPVTADYVTARNFAAQLSPTMVSRQGTAIGAAIDLAVSSFSSESEGSRVIVLITDGENHEDDALEAARRAADRGIRIYVIGIGTPEGAPIVVGDEFIRDENGDMVVSKLDEKVLQQIALVTDGAYVRATNRQLGLDEVVDRIRRTEKTRLSENIYEEYDELYGYFIALAILLLVAESVMLGRKNRVLGRIDLFKSH